MKLESGTCVSELLLFQDVRNAGAVKEMLINCQLDAAVFDAELILDTFQIQISLTSALEKCTISTTRFKSACISIDTSSVAQNALTCRNVNTEIMYNVSGNRNITKALKTFGISNTTTYLLAVIVHPTEEKISQVHRAVEGLEVPNVSEHLAEHANLNRIQDSYGIHSNELQSGSLIDSIVTRIACRDVQ